MNSDPVHGEWFYSTPLSRTLQGSTLFMNSDPVYSERVLLYKVLPLLYDFRPWNARFVLLVIAYYLAGYSQTPRRALSFPSARYKMATSHACAMVCAF
jgi:hypothetical protein